MFRLLFCKWKHFVHNIHQTVSHRHKKNVWQQKLDVKTLCRAYSQLQDLGQSVSYGLRQHSRAVVWLVTPKNQNPPGFEAPNAPHLPRGTRQSEILRFVACCSLQDPAEKGGK